MRTHNWTRASLFILAAGAVLTLGLPVEAQVPDSSPVVAPADSVNLTMEQKHVIKEIILKDLKVQGQSANVPIQVGDKIPSGIPLQPMPVEVSAKVPQLKSHSFIVKDDKVVIVDPKDNKIAALVE
jgi:Protein of unknown function (DUF1236)